MRGFSEYKQAKSPVLGEKAYFAFIKGQELKNNKTENAKRWFETPPYYLLCRKENKDDGTDESL